MTAYIGIDPGQTGAIALVTHTGVLSDVVPMPTQDSEVVGSQLAEILETYRDSISDRVVVVIEQVNSMPGQGVSSTFKFGKSFGIALGVVQALQLPLHRVTPQAWKKTFVLIGKDKDASRGKATELWPSMAFHWKYKNQNGASDAALIAEHARRIGL
jgi:crossover junction endodeoxyribonuclease RuvC